MSVTDKIGNEIEVGSYIIYSSVGTIGEVLDIKTPTCTGLINCASAALNVDYRETGRTITKLGIDNIKKCCE